jgi:shikimate dehydrogenase
VGGRHILIVGTGGAARAIGYYLCKEASRVSLFDIDSAKADSLTGHLNAVKGNAKAVTKDLLGSPDFIASVDMIINATPLGLKPDDPSPLAPELLAGSQTVVDLIYKETPLLKAAELKGCTTLNGLGMLLWQGVIAFELWTGVKPPVAVMREALLQGIAPH